MSDLETKIRELATRGELTHLSIVPVAGKGPNGVVWSASYSPASKWGSGFGRDADPVKAMMMAFDDVRLPKLIKKLAATSPEAAAVAESVETGALPPPDADAKLTKQVRRRAVVAGAGVGAGAALAADDSDFL